MFAYKPPTGTVRNTGLGVPVFIASGFSPAGPEASISRWPRLLPPPVQDTILEAFQAQATEFTRTTASVIDTGHKHEPNPWLARTGWATHLQGYDHIRLRTAVGLKPTEGWPPTTDPSDSLVLQEVFGSIDRLVRRAQALASPSSVPQPVLFLLHQRNRDQKPSTPFSGQMEDATRTTYSNIWKQVIGYFFRTEVWEPGTVPPYKLSTAQENAINDIEVFFRIADGAVTVTR
ncbi:hypothetical protein PG988_016058 [Apiospora saccharicola]